MPIIWAPPIEESKSEKEIISETRKAFIESFFSAVSWKCSNCGLINHGWNERCADWRCKNERPNKQV